MLTSDQIVERRSGIGATDISAILGINPYKTALKVYKEKIDTTSAEDLAGKQEEYTKEQLRRMRFGSFAEDYILDVWNEEHAHEEVKAVKDDRLFRHPNYKYIISHIDASVCGAPLLLEFKSVDSLYFRDKSAWDENLNIIPVNYLVQCAHERLVYSLDTGNDIESVLLVACVGSSGNIVEFRYDKNGALESKILEACHKFWRNVENRIEPECMTYEDAIDKFWDTCPEAIVATHEHQEMLQCAKKLQEEIKRLEQEQDKIKAKIGEIMGHNEVLVSTDGKPLVTWKKQKSSRFDIGLVKSKMPDMYHKFIKETESRVMRIK